MDSLGETDKLPEAYNVPRLNHKERENLDRPITSKKIKLVTKNLLTNKKFKTRQWILLNTPKKTFTNPSQTLQKNRREGTLSYSFYEASMILVPTSDHGATKKENYRPISLGT